MIIRTILIVAGISIASGCSVSSSRYAAKPSVNPASIVQINQHLEIPSQKARVYIQNGVETTMRNIDKFSTYCSVLMQNVHSRGEPLLTVSPGRFEIIKLRKSNDSLYFPGSFFVSRGWTDDFPSVVIFEVEIRLKSAEQPGVRALFCAKQADVYGPLFLTRHYPTLAEIRFALGNAIEIETP
jgi:hypothetical protein